MPSTDYEPQSTFSTSYSGVSINSTDYSGEDFTDGSVVRLLQDGTTRYLQDGVTERRTQ